MHFSHDVPCFVVFFRGIVNLFNCTNEMSGRFINTGNKTLRRQCHLLLSKIGLRNIQ